MRLGNICLACWMRSGKMKKNGQHCIALMKSKSARHYLSILSNITLIISALHQSASVIVQQSFNARRALLTVEIWAKQGRFEKEILATKSFFQFHLLGETVNLIGLEGQAFWRIENMRTPPGVVEGDYFVSDLYIDTTYDIVAGELPRVRNN